MAITAESSPQYKDVTDPRQYGGVDATYFRDVQFLPFTFTQSAAAGDDGSTALLLHLQQGRYVVWPRSSRIAWSAFGASRVTDVGFSAYTNEAGGTVAAAPVRMDENVDISSAGAAALGSDLAIADEGGIALSVGLGGVTVLMTVTGGTIPAAAVVNGYLAVSRIA